MNIAEITKSGDKFKLAENNVQWTSNVNIKDGNYKIGIRPHNITTYKEGSNSVDKGKVHATDATNASRTMIYNITSNRWDDTILNNFEHNESLSVKVEFLDMYVAHVDNNLHRYFKKPDEAKVADAILTIFRNREHLEIFNKKAIYIYIRELTKLETPIIL